MTIKPDYAICFGEWCAALPTAMAVIDAALVVAGVAAVALAMWLWYDRNDRR